MSGNAIQLAKQLKDRARAQRMAGQPSYVLLEEAARELERLHAIVQSYAAAKSAQVPPPWPPKSGV